MQNGLTVAVINGIEKFGAKRLASVLAGNEIKVLGLGEETAGVEEIKGFEYRMEAGELEPGIDYWFDFKEEEIFWRQAEQDKGKLVVAGVNKTVKKLDKLAESNLNWRVVNCHGVYGPGMERSVGKEEVDYLMEAIELAVRNKNLILPVRNEKLRLLASDEVTEVITRACFLSGTEKEIFEIWGKETNSEEIARVLIDEAKMTRFRVLENDKIVKTADEQEIITNWKKLKWQPEIELAEGMKETLQYFFTIADEEGRRKKDQGGPEIKKKAFEVVVEEEEEVKEMEKVEEEAEKKDGQCQITNDKKEVEIGEIKPFLIKNSNIRSVKVKEENKEQQITNDKCQMSDVKEEKKETIKWWKKIKEVNWLKWLGVAGGGVFLGGLLIISIWGWKNYAMFKEAVKIKTLMETGKFDEASKLIEKTTKEVKKRETETEAWRINRWVWGRRYQNGLKVLDQGLVLGSEAVGLGKKGEIISQAVFAEKEIDWKKELPEFKKGLEQSSDDLGILQARLAGDWNWVPARWKSNFAEVRKQLEQIGKEIEMGTKAVEMLPEMLGTDGKKREYMVLLQNESEIRPTGGFIGSWAWLIFEDGKLIDFQIKDIYEADGQLKGHVEPPEPIKNYLGEASWYMRDANWKPDFGATAKDIQWFLEKETGKKPDGVIGVDLAVIRAILGATGEIYVPDFKAKINKDNLYEQAEFYAETKFFPGSTQKASFLGGLGKQLYEEIKNAKTEKKVKLVKAGLEMLQKKELLLAFNDQKIAKTAAEMNWDGAIYNGKCAQERCFADYLYVVEANLGVNKANYFLYRNIEQSIDISKQAIARVVKITYENTAKNNSWPGGDYKNYLRVYIPRTSNLAEVSVSEDGKGGAKTIYQEGSLKIAEYGGKKEVGFLVTVPVGKKRIVEVRYSDQIDLSNKDKFSYLHYVQKQTGSGDTGLVTLVAIPEGWSLNQVEPMASLVNGKILFNQKLDRDIKMGVEIGK